MKNIYIAGQEGMVGSAVCRLLNKKKISFISCSRKNVDLTNYAQVEKWFKKNKPKIVINCAGKVGGILDNSLNQEQFINKNLLIGFNLINASIKFNVDQFINLGSACIYPKLTKLPIKEEYLLTSKLEDTNEGYAIAKIATLKYCQFLKKKGFNFISLQPTNLYGINDNYDLKSSHVIPALVRKFYDAKIKKIKYVKVWGSPNTTRDFINSDDLARLIVFILGKNIEYDYINVGSGREISISRLIKIISKVTGFKGKIIYETNMPAGQNRRVLDISKMVSIKFAPKINLEKGLLSYYKWFKSSYKKN